MSALNLVAESWDGGHPWWPLIWLFWLAFVATVFVLFLRRGRWGGWRADHRPGAESILGERYARGEINAEEYRERLETLRSR